MPDMDLCGRIADLAIEAPMPAVAVAVVTESGTVAQVVHGTADLTTGAPVTADHWWDLASLTKLLVTLPEVLALASDPAGLETALADLWPRARPAQVGRATLADLLSHRAGLPAHLPFHVTAADRDEVVADALKAPLTHGEPIYSDLGFLMLGEAVVYATGVSLPELAAVRFGLRFGPLDDMAVATEQCPWRQRLVVGEVHDENASAMGGVAGHAGAFGRIADVAEAVRRYLMHMVVSSELHAATLSTRVANTMGQVFGLGWWHTPSWGLGGPRAGSDSYGASGFVGNRLWFEPSRGYAVVVLSNRIHPVRLPRGSFNLWCDRLTLLIADSHAAGSGTW
jgi:CubicO group peptidase (beta-lactamase class C family)